MCANRTDKRNLTYAFFFFVVFGTGYQLKMTSSIVHMWSAKSFISDHIVTIRNQNIRSIIREIGEVSIPPRQT